MQVWNVDVSQKEVRRFAEGRLRPFSTANQKPSCRGASRCARKPSPAGEGVARSVTDEVSQAIHKSPLQQSLRLAFGNPPPFAQGRLKRFLVVSLLRMTDGIV